MIKKSEVIKRFGSVQLVAQFFEVAEAAVYQWGELIPMSRAYELQARRKEIPGFLRRKQREAIKRAVQRAKW